MTVVIRELGLLRCEDDSPPADVPAVSLSAFDWIRENYCEKSSDGRPAYFSPVSSNRKYALKAQGYVGVLRTRCGTDVEILPKTLEDDEDIASAQWWLPRMLESLPDWPKNYPHGSVDTRTIRRSLPDVLRGHFLDSVNALVKRGIRHGYRAQQGNERFLRGRLLIAENLRFNAVRRDRFFVEYDAFLIDRPANRLLRSALEHVKTRSRVFDHQKLCHELLFVFAEVPVSTDFRADLARCNTGRGMVHYRTPLKWARLILLGLAPLTTRGSNEGEILLFPMDELFESYVAQQLHSIIPRPFKLISKVSRHTFKKHLVKHEGRDRFGLIPDLTVMCLDRPVVVLDAKWKVLNAAEEAKDYGLSQDDFYQMYAYGRKYLGGRGELFLIYPQTKRFSQPLEPFHFEENSTLTLHVVPFDMNTGRLEPKAQELLLAALRKSGEVKGQAA